MPESEGLDLRSISENDLAQLLGDYYKTFNEIPYGQLKELVVKGIERVRNLHQSGESILAEDEKKLKPLPGMERSYEDATEGVRSMKQWFPNDVYRAFVDLAVTQDEAEKNKSLNTAAAAPYDYVRKLSRGQEVYREGMKSVSDQDANKAYDYLKGRDEEVSGMFNKASEIGNLASAIKERREQK